MRPKQRVKRGKSGVMVIVPKRGRKRVAAALMAAVATAGALTFQAGRRLGRAVTLAERRPPAVVRLAPEMPKPKLPGGKPPQQKPKQQLRVYKPGLSGRALAKAYGVEFAQHWKDKFTPSEALLHDIKIMIAEECAKYNKRCKINRTGKQLVDPYQVYTTFSVETNFNPNAIGKNGELGIGQLKKDTLDDLAKWPMPVKVTDPFDLRQNIAASVRHYAWLARAIPSEKRTTWRKYAAYNQGYGAAVVKPQDSKAAKKANQYAKKSWDRHRRFRKKGVFRGY